MEPYWISEEFMVDLPVYRVLDNRRWKVRPGGR